jgi:hypothetical protein
MISKVSSYFINCKPITNIDIHNNHQYIVNILNNKQIIIVSIFFSITYLIIDDLVNPSLLSKIISTHTK